MLSCRDFLSYRWKMIETWEKGSMYLFFMSCYFNMFPHFSSSRKHHFPFDNKKEGKNCEACLSYHWRKFHHSKELSKENRNLFFLVLKATSKEKKRLWDLNKWKGTSTISPPCPFIEKLLWVLSTTLAVVRVITNEENCYCVVVC